ncbi:hemerythrin domain-containing protein [Chitinimonas lacunae]|uniref:Hemerythrin domain-containing protein n=1 Tax=Chitinimonas lacunae TaxID=1963018 RepID=A0ABV8MMX4_9NEIS
MDPIFLLLNQHHEADDELAAVEAAVRDGDWAEAERRFAAFERSLTGHFNLEETRLFPAFEQATGMRFGPTVVMRDEHACILELLENCREPLREHDAQVLLSEVDTLLVMIQQHNVKEENVLYPMCRLRVADLERVVGEDNMVVSP